jgi:hypothetical protein
MLWSRDYLESRSVPGLRHTPARDVAAWPTCGIRCWCCGISGRGQDRWDAAQAAISRSCWRQRCGRRMIGRIHPEVAGDAATGQDERSEAQLCQAGVPHRRTPYRARSRWRVQRALLISFTPRLSRRRRRSRNVPPSLYPTFAAISSTLALLVFKRCTARSTRRP